MKLHRYKEVHNYEVENWLKETLELDNFQISTLKNEEVVRFAPFIFYKYKKTESNIFWRITLPLFGIWIALLIIFIPIYFMFTGQWGYSRKIYDVCIRQWASKLGL